MDKYHLVLLTLLRVSLGWFFFFAGITKVLDPDWSAAGFLGNAAMFPNFYAFFLHPSILPVVNFLNEWGLTLVGVGLMLGISVRLSAYVGALLMLLYYFPHDNTHGFIVDDHVVYVIALFVLASTSLRSTVGMHGYLVQLPIVKRSPLLKNFLS
jgi:thiosulfate dehydrogenase [quinone] large subunit